MTISDLDEALVNELAQFGPVIVLVANDSPGVQLPPVLAVKRHEH